MFQATLVEIGSFSLGPGKSFRWQRAITRSEYLQFIILTTKRTLMALCFGFIFGQNVLVLSQQQDEDLVAKTQMGHPEVTEGQMLRFDSLMTKRWSPGLRQIHVQNGNVVFAAGESFYRSKRGTISGAPGPTLICRCKFPDHEEPGIFQVEPEIVAYTPFADVRFLVCNNDDLILLIDDRTKLDEAATPRVGAREFETLTKRGVYFETANGFERINLPKDYKAGCKIFSSPNADRLIFVMVPKEIRGRQITKIIELDIPSRSFGEAIDVPIDDARTHEKAAVLRTNGTDLIVADSVAIDRRNSTQRIRNAINEVEYVADHTTYNRMLWSYHLKFGLNDPTDSRFRFSTVVDNRERGGLRHLVITEVDLENQSSRQFRFDLNPGETNVLGGSWSVDGEYAFILPHFVDRPELPARAISFLLSDPSQFSSITIPGGFATISDMTADGGYLYFKPSMNEPWIWRIRHSAGTK